MSADRSLAELMAEVFRRAGMKRPLGRAQLVILWPRVAGPELARFTRATSFKDGILYVDTTDSETAMHLSLQRNRFIQGYRELGHRELREIRFRPGRIELKESEESEPLPRTAAQEDLQPLQHGLGSLDLPDPVVRAALEAASGIARTRTHRRRLGWRPCEVCTVLCEDGQLCLTCRRYSQAIPVRQAADKLVKQPRLEPAWLTGEQLLVAAWLARQDLERLMQSLLPQVVADPRVRPQLEHLAGNWLALLLEVDVGRLTPEDWQRLPLKVRRVLGH